MKTTKNGKESRKCRPPLEVTNLDSEKMGDSMKYYYVNKQPQSNGDHEVHAAECSFLPDVQNREYLGYFNNCREAVATAKRTYPGADGCFYCSRECHTR